MHRHPKKPMSTLRAWVWRACQHRRSTPHSRQRVRGLLGNGLGAIALALMATLLFNMTPALGQLPVPLPSASPQPTEQRPSGVKRFGDLETAPVYFQNAVLLRVAVPISQGASEESSAFRVDERARLIEDNLNRTVARDPDYDDQSDTRDYVTLFDPRSFRVEIAILNNDTILMARDGTNREAQVLLTVTDADARYQRLNKDELAIRWRDVLQQELQDALEAAQPEEMLRQANRAGQIGLGMVLLSLGLGFVQQGLNRRGRVLKARHAEETANAAQSGLALPHRPVVARSQRFEFLAALHHQFTLERRLGLVNFLKWLAFWGQAVIWVGGATWILSLFPATRWLATLVLLKPIQLIGVWFIVGLLNRLGDMVINRFSKVWESSELFTFEDAQRRSLRISTIIRASKGLKTFVVYAVGIGWGLSLLGVPTGSVLTFGAVVALALSLASQNLIKDLVNGFLILVEDQYGIGDIVQIGTASGLVENMNLRITQLRNAEGRLITIPNSLIDRVENLTRLWSRVDFTILIAYHNDVTKALEVLRRVAEDLFEDPAWRPLMIKAPEVLGIDQISHEGILIRVWLETQPLKQFAVGREFRLRVRLALDDYGIEIGAPQQVFVDQTGRPLHTNDVHSEHNHSEHNQHSALENGPENATTNASETPDGTKPPPSLE